MSLLTFHYTPSLTLTRHHIRHRQPPSLHHNLHLSTHHNNHHLSLSKTHLTIRPTQYDSDEEPDPEPTSTSIPDEWGEKSGSEPEPETRFDGADPVVKGKEDEWGEDKVEVGVEEVGESEGGMGNVELKRCLIDTVYGSGFGFGASSEVRGEVSELVTQLEAVNPVTNPTEVPRLLDGNWILLYTASSELVPLIALGTTPLLKVERISQNIDTASGIVENATTLSTPFATFSFSATASFEVRSSSRIQVQFKEASFKPPEIKSRIDLPESVDIFGQQIALSPVQQLLNPVQEAAASISGTLYGLPPLKVPIPGERSSSWLIITYLDDDFRISRGDGGLFVLVREGSPLLD